MEMQRIDPNMAVIMFKDGTRIMFSFDVPVAAYIPGRGYVKSSRYFSRSSNYHIVQFANGNMAVPVDHGGILALAQDGY